MRDHMPNVEIDFTISNPARVYDYLLGGKDNFAVDREVAENMARPHGSIEVARAAVRAHRAFLGRAVRYLATEPRIRQFLDIGCGIPTVKNTHEVAQETAPDARIVYVDNDPVVLAHAHELLRSSPEGGTAFLHGDLREPDRILPVAAETLDFDQPVAIMLLGILHFIGDEDDPYGIVGRLMEAVPPGSYLAIMHLASDIDADMNRVVKRHNNAKVQAPGVLRDHGEVCSFFDGLEMVEPGVVRTDLWHPDETDPALPNGVELPSYAGVGLRP